MADSHEQAGLLDFWAKTDLKGTPSGPLDQDLGKGKSLRKGRWLAENNPCPSKVDLLYRRLAESLAAQQLSSRND